MSGRFLVTMIIVAALVVGTSAVCDSPDGAIAPGVTVTGTTSVKIGMSEREVMGLLGPPLRRIEPFYSGQSCPTDGGCDPAGERGVVQLTYAEDDPRLWIYLVDGGVTQVYAKRDMFFGVDDEAVFCLAEHREGAGWLQPACDWRNASFQSAFPK